MWASAGLRIRRQWRRLGRPGPSLGVASRAVLSDGCECAVNVHPSAARPPNHPLMLGWHHKPQQQPSPHCALFARSRGARRRCSSEHSEEADLFNGRGARPRAATSLSLGSSAPLAESARPHATRPGRLRVIYCTRGGLFGALVLNRLLACEQIEVCGIVVRLRQLCTHPLPAWRPASTHHSRHQRPELTEVSVRPLAGLARQRFF